MPQYQDKIVIKCSCGSTTFKTIVKGKEYQCPFCSRCISVIHQKKSSFSWPEEELQDWLDTPEKRTLNEIEIEEMFLEWEREHREEF